MKPTLDQAGKVIELISQSGRTDEWVQEHLIGSGAFSDLLAVDNLRDMNRDARRRFLGIKPLNPLLLEHLGTTDVLATTGPLIVRDEFVIGVNGVTCLGENFKQWFYPKVEVPTAAATLRYSKLTRSELDGPITEELGGAVETILGHVLALIKRQKNGEAGVLLNNGLANIFYVKDAAGLLRAVRVLWLGVGWSVDAFSVSNPHRWFHENRVFSRNS